MAGAAALALATAPAPAHASPSQFSIFEAPRDVLSFDAATRSSAFEQMRAFGVTHTRVLVRWNSVVRKPNARKKPSSLKERDPNSSGYRFELYDAIFRLAEQQGIEVIPTITGDAPRWATAGGRGDNFKVNRDRFARFVEAVGKRYGDQVTRWTIWNEPNQPQFLRPQFERGKPYSPKLYRALYQAALQGLGKSDNGSDAILAGETSPAGNTRIVAPLTFLRIFFQGRKLDIDGWAHHPYTKRIGPFYKPRTSTEIRIGTLGRLTKALDRYSKHRRMKVYLTEFGIQSLPDRINGVSQLKQAEFRSISEKIAYDNPRVAAFSQYLLRDDLPRGKGVNRYGGFESGLRTYKGKKKASYEGYRLPLVARRSGSATRLWGLVRPTTESTEVTVQSRDGSGSWKDLADVETNGRGYWTKRTKYRSGRIYRVKWTTFTGPRTRVYP